MNPSQLQQSLAEGEKRDVLVYKKNRRCIKKDYKRLLSVYNFGPTCYPHAPWWNKKEDERMEKERLYRGRTFERRKYIKH